MRCKGRKPRKGRKPLSPLEIWHRKQIERVWHDMRRAGGSILAPNDANFRVTQMRELRTSRSGCGFVVQR